jgi:WD40 repeat protein
MTRCHAVQLSQGDQAPCVLELGHIDTHVLAALSSKSIAIIELDRGAIWGALDVQAHINKMCTSTAFPNCLFSVSNASCALWDLRAPGTQKLTFANYMSCPVSDHQTEAFDLGPFGSGFISGDANSASFFATGDHLGNIHLWDLRMPEKLLNRPLGHISEFHTGMVTGVRFHPIYPNLLFSGSEDGLVQKFDLNAHHVEDSLLSGKHSHMLTMISTNTCSIQLGANSKAPSIFRPKSRLYIYFNRGRDDFNIQPKH